MSGSHPEAHDGLFALSLRTWPESRLTSQAESAAFFAGDTPGLDRLPDDVSDVVADIRANLADWRSGLIPVRAVFLESAPAV